MSEKVFEVVEELLNRRNDLEKKLDKLEKMKEQTKPNVYKKVKGDYETRLSEVNNELLSYSASLKESMNALQPQLEKITEQINEIDDIIEELKVRFELEEFTKDEYDNQSKEHLRKLEELKKQKEIHENEIKQVQSMLQQIEKTENNFLEESLSDIGEETLIEEVTEEDFISESDNNDNMGIVSSDKVLEELEDTEDINDINDMGDISDIDDSLIDDTDIENGLDGLDDLESLEDEFGGDDINSLADELSDELGLEELDDVVADSDIIHEDDLQLDGGGEVEGIKCPKCGFVNKPDAWFCEKCGADLQ